MNTVVNKDNNSITVYLHHAIDVESFESKIKAIDSKVYLDRLREQYKRTKEPYNGLEGTRYNAIRLFCIESSLLSFNDIEVMEFEINNLS